MPTLTLRILVLAFTACMVSAAPAAELGRVPMNGRTVIIDDNGTWSYAPDNAPVAVNTCIAGRVLQSKKLPLSLCLPSNWKIVKPDGSAFEIQAVDLQTDTYFGLITERTIISREFLKQAIIEYAASAMQTTSDNVPIISETREQIGGKDWDYIIYDITLRGSKFRFGNFYLSLGDLGAVQVVFWCSTPYFDEVKEELRKVAQGIQFTKDVP
jgi:hypothetical protein